MGLYAEQLSGTPFTYAKHKNKRAWLYRVLPTVRHGNWEDHSKDAHYQKWVSNFEGHGKGLNVTPEQLRWKPQKFASDMFHHSIKTLAGAGSPDLKTGLSINHYTIGKDMTSSRVALYSSDGDMLIVP